MANGIEIIKLSDGAIVPTKATEQSIGYDVFLPKDYRIEMGRQVLPLDFSLAMPSLVEAKIEPRSGFSAKGILAKVYRSETSYEERRIDADVIVGKIDPDYRGNVGVIIKCNETSKYGIVLPKGLRIAQMTFYKTESVTLSEVKDFSVTADKEENLRGAGGFGSTGTTTLKNEEKSSKTIKTTSAKVQ